MKALRLLLGSALAALGLTVLGCQTAQTAVKPSALPAGIWRAVLPAEGDKPAVGFEIAVGSESRGWLILPKPDMDPDFDHGSRTSINLKPASESEYHAHVGTFRWSDDWTFRFLPSGDPSVRKALMIEANNPDAADPEVCTFVRQPAAPGQK